MQECGKWKTKNNPSPQPQKMQEQSPITGKGPGGGDSEAVPLNISYCLDPQGRVLVTLCSPQPLHLCSTSWGSSVGRRKLSQSAPGAHGGGTVPVAVHPFRDKDNKDLKGLGTEPWGKTGTEPTQAQEVGSA